MKIVQVVRKGHTVDLLIDLFWMSVEGARPELACPDMVRELLTKHAIDDERLRL